MTESISPAEQQLQTIVDAAQQMGVELDREEALQWLTAIAAAKTQDQVQFDERTGVFGHRIVMLDFSEEQLAYFREVGRLVEFKDEPGVETALALSGSAAQSKVQCYPGDCDYFERVNIHATTREEACATLARLMREKALATRRVPGAQLIEVKFGTYPLDVIVDGRHCKAGAPIAWNPDQIEHGQIEGVRMNGARAVISWEDAAAEPGWCKLDWVVFDPVRRRLANASNMLDVTWEAPDGSITPLDGYLDPYFQEIYLQAESVPIFTKLAQHVSADAMDEYVEALEGEVRKYLTKQVNYGKAAKRMYNIFRLNGSYAEAVYLRELFDEPASLLYQIWSLIRTVDDAIAAKAPFQTEQLIRQAEELMMEVIRVMEDVREAEIVRRILRFRDAIHNLESYEALSAEAEAAREEVINVVNNFFYEKMTAVPNIKAYMDSVQESG